MTFWINKTLLHSPFKINIEETKHFYYQVGFAVQYDTSKKVFLIFLDKRNEVEMKEIMIFCNIHQYS